MCMSSPHIPSQNNTPVEYLHNSYLDKGMIGQGFTTGRNQLRIDLNQTRSAGINPTAGIQARPGVTSPGTTVPAFNQPGQSPLTQPGLGITVPTPGTVTPTVGGALAGTLPGVIARPAPVRPPVSMNR